MKRTSLGSLPTVLTRLQGKVENRLIGWIVPGEEEERKVGTARGLEVDGVGRGLG